MLLCRREGGGMEIFMAIGLGKMRKRCLISFSVAGILFAALSCRIGYWQFVKGEELKAKAESQQTRSVAVTANRGTIYDRNGKVIAESASVDTVVCNPKQVQEDKACDVVADRLSEILGMDRDEVYKLVTKDKGYQVIKKRITAEESQKVRELKDTSRDKATAKLFTGVYFETDSKRFYSYSIASQVIGFTGYDNNGLYGVEKTFDAPLTGKNGSILSLSSAGGTSIDMEYEESNPSQKGADVMLTIDETIQHLLEKHLENAVIESQLKEGAAGIVMNPKTGEILAMASKPDFDLNDPYSIDNFLKYAIDLNQDEVLREYDSSNEEAKDKAIAGIRNKMWRNKAISDTYEPGSTFKIITAAIALEENVVDLNSSFYCSGAKQVADRKIRCHKREGHGAETFVQGVQNSCNPVFMELGLRVGGEKFMDYFKAFGFTEKTGVELIGESGSIYYKHKMSETDVATSAFGQGFSITPIQLVTAVSAVVNGGDLMKPHIVKEIRNGTGILKSYQPEVVNKVISQETSDMMKEILEGVVSSPTGSGRNAYIKGYRIGGKTGTSEKGRNNDKRIASFIGFAPADDPQIVVLIMMDEPQVAVRYGGTIAAPVVGSLIEETLDYLGIERQYTESEAENVSTNVPEVRGMTVAQAKSTIEAAGFKVRVKGENETVADQLPKPGVSIGANSTVIIYTDEIPEDNYVTVPNVTGLSAENAKAELEDYGLNFEISGAGRASAGARAVKQSINPGERVAPATVVSVEFRNESSD